MTLMSMLPRLALALSVAACSTMQAPEPRGTSAAITPEDLRQRLYPIADDSMMGRESGSLGDYKTADYVAREFRRLGLEPGGENGTYFQTVPFWNAAIDPQSRLEAANAREPLPFVFDYRYDAPGHPLQYYCRADHYSYARYGIPAVAFSRGEHMGSAGSKRAVLRTRARH